MPLPVIALLLVGGVVVAAAASAKPKEKKPAPKPPSEGELAVALDLADARSLVHAITTTPKDEDEQTLVFVAMRPSPAPLQRIDDTLLARAVDAFDMSSFIVGQTGPPHLTGPSIAQLREMALRTVWKHKNGGGAAKRVARIVNGQRSYHDHTENIQAACDGMDVAGMPAGIENEYDQCAHEYMEGLPPMTEYEQSRLLFNVIWHYIKRGFFLVGGPDKKPPPEEVAELVTITMEAILSEVDPARAPDPSEQARYQAIAHRAEQVIEWPRCGDLEGCQGHYNRRKTELDQLKTLYSGEERIVRIAEWTGNIVIERIRTLKVNMPTNFGDFLIEVALPAMIAGVALAIEIWGAIVDGDEIDWSYPENVYGGGEVNEVIAAAKATYEQAAGAYQEGEETLGELESAAAAFSGTPPPCADGYDPHERARNVLSGGACCDSCADGRPCEGCDDAHSSPASFFGHFVPEPRSDAQDSAHGATEATSGTAAAPVPWWASEPPQGPTARDGLQALAANAAPIDRTLLLNWLMQRSGN